MVDPPPWPSRPDDAVDFDAFWLVRRLPPDPFPLEDHDYGSDPQFGPPGTRWVFSIESLVNRRTAPGVSQGAKAAIDKLLNKFGNVPPLGSTSWATPLALAPPATAVEMELGNMMRWIRTQIVAALSTDEEVVHVHNWRHATTENAPITNAELKTFTTAVATAYGAFLGQAKSSLSPELTYREVRGSVLEQDAPGGEVRWPQQTQVTPYSNPANSTGTGAASLPYEVALCLSLNTNFRGTGRFRGRTYLGPMAQGVMGAAGNFNPATVQSIAANFGTLFLQGVETATDYECHVVSQKFGTSAKVTGVRVGQVPDSQRRRRRDRPENHFQAWGTAVGGLA